jgi:hypothetical protein
MLDHPLTVLTGSLGIKVVENTQSHDELVVGYLCDVVKICFCGEVDYLGRVDITAIKS